MSGTFCILMWVLALVMTAVGFKTSAAAVGLVWFLAGLCSLMFVTVQARKSPVPLFQLYRVLCWVVMGCSLLFSLFNIL